MFSGGCQFFRIGTLQTVGVFRDPARFCQMRFASAYDWSVLSRLQVDGVLVGFSLTVFCDIYGSGNSDLLPGAYRPETTAELVTLEIGRDAYVCGPSKLGSTFLYGCKG